jgi:Xaa-Pro aminopeptidase
MRGDGGESMGQSIQGITDEEYRQRWQHTQRVMARENCELLLVYGDDHSFSGPANVRYLCDYAPHFEPAVIVLAAEGDPALVTGPELKAYALLQSRIKTIIAIHEFGLPGQEYPFVDLTSLSRAAAMSLQSDADTIKRVGIAGMELMSHTTMSTIMGLFRNAEIVDAGPWLTSIRMVKSDSEIGIIRRAYEIADEGLKACIGCIEEGATEHEVAAEGEYAMRRLGAEGTGMDTVVGSGPFSRPIIARTTNRRIEHGDLVAISIGPRFQGYHGQLGRPVFLGKRVPSELDRAMKSAREAQELVREALKPGAVGEEVEAAGRRHIEKAGLKDYYVYSSCHSVGTAEAEEPVLGPGSKVVVQRNMVFSIDIPLFLAPFGGFRYEDGFLVTDNGTVKLNKTV